MSVINNSLDSSEAGVQEAVLAQLLAWLREMTGELKLNDLSAKMLHRLLEFTRMERGFVILREGENLSVLQSHELDPGDPHQEASSLSWSLTQEAITKGQTLFTSNAQGDERLLSSESVVSLDLRAILVVPFRFQAKVLGAVYLDSHLTGAQLQDHHLPLLEGVADLLGIAVNNALLFEKTEADLLQTKEALERSQEELALKYRYKNIIGQAPSFKSFLQRVDKVTEVQVPVLILGESGSGKELIAKAIHYNGPLSQGPLVTANCSAIPETLVESELFGHERGAFTGADKNRAGLFEQANGGTLFLDEIAEMPLPAQAKLLRVLQEGELRPLGSSADIKVQVRVLAATHQDLKSMVSAGKFREDLYYRLNVAEIKVPPLRERQQDLPLLVDHFLELFAKRNQRPKLKIDTSALHLLLRYPWPGNIRELENSIYNLCVFAEGKRLSLEDLKQKPELAKQIKGLDAKASGAGGLLSEALDRGELSLSEAKRRFERQEILRVLKKYHYKVGKASEHLGMARPQLSRLIKYHQISKD